MTRTLKCILFAFVLNAILITEVHANTVKAASCSQADVQSAVNSAVTGDTVTVLGPCTVNWPGFVTIASSQGITVQASGTVILDTASNGFIINQGSSTTRVTGFICNRASNIPTDYNGHCVQVNGNTGSAPFRIDHWTMCGGGGACTAQSIFINLSGNGPGLIDHNTMKGGSASVFVQNFGNGDGNTAGWQDNITPGGPNFVYHEDNTAVNAACLSNCNWGSASYIQAYYGARNVFRHNTFQMVNIDEHGSHGGGEGAVIGAVGVRWWEIYNNNFVVVSGGNWWSYMDLRAGSGVVFNNTVSGTNLGSGLLHVYEENTLAWPQAFQVGSGISSTTSPHNACGSINTSPAYFWNNPGMTISDASTPDPGGTQANRDYFASSSQPASMHRYQSSGDSCSTTYSYAPYTYPHPLVQGLAALNPPTNLNASVQ